MRKTAVSVAFVSVLLISASAKSFGLAWANPYIEGYFPLEPTTRKPSIAIESPIQNCDYSLGDAWLNFTITKPETWFVRDVASTENHESLTLAIGRISRVHYVLDNGEPQNITVEDGDLPSDFSIAVFPTRIFNFSVRLILTGGLHSVKAGFEADTYYYTGWDTSHPGLRSVKVDGLSEVVNFRIGEPVQTELIAAASTVVAMTACAGLLVYFKRWKR